MVSLYPNPESLLQAFWDSSFWKLEISLVFSNVFESEIKQGFSSIDHILGQEHQVQFCSMYNNIIPEPSQINQKISQHLSLIFLRALHLPSCRAWAMLKSQRLGAAEAIVEVVFQTPFDAHSFLFRGEDYQVDWKSFTWVETIKELCWCRFFSNCFHGNLLNRTSGV